MEDRTREACGCEEADPRRRTKAHAPRTAAVGPADQFHEHPALVVGRTRPAGSRAPQVIARLRAHVRPPCGASTEAARARSPSLAREAHEPVVAAVRAREAHGPVREHPTPQVLAQLVHHEAGHRLVGLGASSQERLEVLTHEAMQHRGLRARFERKAGRSCIVACCDEHEDRSRFSGLEIPRGDAIEFAMRQQATLRTQFCRTVPELGGPGVG